MGKALSGELSCLCDRSCFILQYIFIVFLPEFKLTFPALTGISALAYFVQNCVLSVTRTQKHPENNVSNMYNMNNHREKFV